MSHTTKWPQNPVNWCYGVTASVQQLASRGTCFLLSLPPPQGPGPCPVATPILWRDTPTEASSQALSCFAGEPTDHPRSLPLLPATSLQPATGQEPEPHPDDHSPLTPRRQQTWPWPAHRLYAADSTLGPSHSRQPEGNLKAATEAGHTHLPSREEAAADIDWHLGSLDVGDTSAHPHSQAQASTHCQRDEETPTGMAGTRGWRWQ